MIVFKFLIFALVSGLQGNPVNDKNLNTNGSPNYDVIQVDVVNTGSAETSAIKFTVFFDESTDLIEYSARKKATDQNEHDSSTKTSFEPIDFTDDSFNVENEVASSSLSLGSDEKGSHKFAYESFGGSTSKRINRFSVSLQMEDAQNTEVIFSSANFNVSNYPPNSKHLYLFRCDHDHNFNVEMTHFDVEQGMDTLTIYSIAGDKTVVSQVNAIGPIETQTNQLLIEFRSDCDTSFSGFRGVLTAVKAESRQVTIAADPVATTVGYQTTQSLTTTPANTMTTAVQTTLVYYGDWIVLLNRYDGNVNFVRNWDDYVTGFGATDKEFWLGLEKIHSLTKNGNFDLRIEMTSFDGRFKYAQYKQFKIEDKSQNYKLSIQAGSYSGDAGDSLDYHNNKEFTSRDNDNDHASGFNCAITHGGGAGGWWAGCGYSNMMGEYGSSGDVGYNFMSWHHFDLSENVALKSMKWMMKPAV